MAGSSSDAPTLQPSPLVGVCLCSESCHTNGQVLGTVYLSPESRSTQTLEKWRRELVTSLSSTLGKRQFDFLTAQGWEINQNLEALVKVSSILTKEGKVNIRFSYDRPRLGIVIEGPPDVSVGYIHCSMSCAVAELEEELASQLPQVYSSLSSRQFCFLDRNSWPLCREQESSLSVLDIASSNSIKIRCSKSKQPSFSRKISMIEDGNQEPVVSDDHRFSISDTLPHNFFSQHSDALQPINEQAEAESVWASSDYTDTKVPVSDIDPFEILLSYVHTEASNYALLLKTALEDLGYSVFLDIHCIEGGKDWQDILNMAITNCNLFIPLITMQYGQTLWTNREIKLADVLEKAILPVNFNKSWPPKCLAIQFATTQYIPGSTVGVEEAMVEAFKEEDAAEIATKIVEQYKKKVTMSRVVMDSGELEEYESGPPPLITRQSTEIFQEREATPPSTGLHVPFVNSRRRSTIKSYASKLPESLPEKYRKSIVSSRIGKPLIVISCSEKQREFAEGLVMELEKEGSEAWCSYNVAGLTDEEKSATFQVKVNDAGAVIFVLSKDFAEDTFCEQQVYYCEQRKRIIPLIYEPIEIPNWMATLIGTSTFISCTSQNYMAALMERVSIALNPEKAEDELKQIIKQKAEIAMLCSDLNKKLPKGDHVYISGGTMFFSKQGEAISKEIGRHLAGEEDIVLVTGGFYGIGETVGRSFFDERTRLDRPHGVCHVVAVRDDNDKSSQTRQNPDGTFQSLPYGDTLFSGSSVRQREMLTPRVVDLCVLIEGGPGAAFEAQQFVWNSHTVIPIRVTGGAAGGSFNIPPAIFIRPPNVAESDWATLGDEAATPSQIGSAVVRIVRSLTKRQEVPVPPGIRSRSGTAEGAVLNSKLKRRRVLMKRADTNPKGFPDDKSTDATGTLRGVRRALSERSALAL